MIMSFCPGTSLGKLIYVINLISLKDAFLAFACVSKDTDTFAVSLLSEEFQFSRFLYELYLCTILQTKEKGTIL